MANIFPDHGIYPEQGNLIRDKFFPGKRIVSARDVNALMLSDVRFKKFMKDLIKHKEKVGQSHFFTHKMAAINLFGVTTFDNKFIIDHLAEPVFAEHWTYLVKEKGGERQASKCVRQLLHWANKK